MEVPRPFGSREPIKVKGWHQAVVSIVLLVVFTLVSLQIWGDTMTFPKVGNRGVVQDKRLSFGVSLDNFEVIKEDLDNGVIPADVQEEFRSNEVTISDSAVAFILDEGATWIIVDGKKKYDVIKKPTRLLVERKLSFGFNLDFQDDLENGRISQGLREEFSDNDVVLSDKAKVSTVREGKKWSITDGRDLYEVSIGENRLSVKQREKSSKSVYLKDPGQDKIQSATEWMTVEGAFIFDRVDDFIKRLLAWITDGLLWLPWPVFITIVALVALRMAGLGVALFSAAGLVSIGLSGFWESAATTLALMATSVGISILIGVPVGILAARNNTVDALVRPILDLMQTMPSFVYLVPFIFFFSLGNVPAVFATILYAVPPCIRLTNLGIRQVSAEAVEAAMAFGATSLQLLLKVQIPLALPTIMAGVNQTVMMALAMVVVASLVGARGLGNDVLLGVNRLEVGQAMMAGMSIVFLAIMIDRITQGFARAREKAIQG